MSYCMDNFRIDITCRGDQPLEKTLILAFDQQKAVGYLITPNSGLVFLHSMAQSEFKLGSAAFPFKMDAIGAADFARRWLAEQDYGPQPDHDGSNTKGWRVYNEMWGHVDGMWTAICAVQPVWAWHGK